MNVIQPTPQHLWATARRVKQAQRMRAITKKAFCAALRDAVRVCYLWGEDPTQVDRFMARVRAALDGVPVPASKRDLFEGEPWRPSHSPAMGEAWRILGCPMPTSMSVETIRKLP